MEIKKAKKLSDFELADKFEDVSILAKINGALHLFNGYFFEKMDDARLEAEIMHRIESELKTMGARKVKDVAFIIKRRKREEVIPGEVEGWRGFENGVWNCFENRFVPFRGSPDSTLPIAPVTFCLDSISLPLEGVPTLKDIGGAQQITAPWANTGIDVSCNMPKILPPNHGSSGAYGNTIPLPPYPSFTMPSPENTNSRYPTPNIDRFFYQISCGDMNLIKRIWEMIGYILAPDINGKVFFLLQGVPNSGKSVLGRFIEGFFPPGRVTSLDISRLGGQFYPEALFDSALNLSMDLPNKRLPLGAVASLKMMTGKDLMTYEPKFKDARPYRGVCKLLFSTNHRLKLHEWDQAFLDRIVCIPFEKSVSTGERDTELSEKLGRERQNVAIKALAYYVALRENKYKFSGNFPPKIDGQPPNSTIINEFVDDCCYFVDFDEGGTHTQDLFEAYQFYCKKRCYIPVDSMAEFSRILHDKYGSKINSSRWREDSRNANGYKGIKLYQITYDDEGNLHRSMVI
ncbi:DUF5906 domain-containing protein [uncultured Flavonifractor sp.]|uniref:DUF5906 domain-containing protein n=1 Tax=uncultured Flavonifractor sp. TaxID=1193534 RepID=UPI0025F5E6B9|nr:DUF5906 domain-containing protein [uncultured Flavonifractor sp.]